MMLAGMPVPALAAQTLGGLVEMVVVLDRLIARLSGFRAEAIEQARVWSAATEHHTSTAPSSSERAEMARRTVVAELACAMRISERAAGNLVADSQALVNDLPSTLAALQTGSISSGTRT
ncbi:MAG TPA: hypothetical protein DCP11_02500 [Microbacteriaceae bacterium]|nr:hypothetical protein [Microbacteriaceae bacterium]